MNRWINYLNEEINKWLPDEEMNKLFKKPDAGGSFPAEKTAARSQKQKPPPHPTPPGSLLPQDEEGSGQKK